MRVSNYLNLPLVDCRIRVHFDPSAWGNLNSERQDRDLRSVASLKNASFFPYQGRTFLFPQRIEIYIQKESGSELFCDTR